MMKFKVMVIKVTGIFAATMLTGLSVLALCIHNVELFVIACCLAVLVFRDALKYGLSDSKKDDFEKNTSKKDKTK